MSGAEGHRPRPPTVTVTGAAEQEVEPTSCIVHGRVEATAADASAALTEVARLQAAVHATAPGMSFDRVATRRWTDDARSRERHGAVSSFAYDPAAELADVGALVAALVGAGAAVDSVQWQVPDDDPAYRDARTAAVRDAARRAEHYAQGLGMVTGAVVALSDGSGGSPVSRLAMAGAARMSGRDEPQLQLDPGTVTIRATATLTLALAMPDD